MFGVQTIVVLKCGVVSRLPAVGDVFSQLKHKRFGGDLLPVTTRSVMWIFHTHRGFFLFSCSKEFTIFDFLMLYTEQRHKLKASQ